MKVFCILPFRPCLQKHSLSPLHLLLSRFFLSLGLWHCYNLGVMGERSTWSPWLVHAAVAGAAISIAAAANYYWRSTSSRGRCRVVGIIPARYQSSRFEGKPLALIMGKPMIQVTTIEIFQHLLKFLSILMNTASLVSDASSLAKC